MSLVTPVNYFNHSGNQTYYLPYSLIKHVCSICLYIHTHTYIYVNCNWVATRWQ